MTRSLNPDQFKISEELSKAFERLDVTRGTHGTSLSEGKAPSQILPAEKIGKRVWTESDPTRTYYTAVQKSNENNDEIDIADLHGWSWAQRASDKISSSGTPGRPVVLDVSPRGRIDLDYNLNEYGNSEEMTADRLKVNNVQWMPPRDWDDVAVQGTLPNENWNKYPRSTGAKYGPDDDLNYQRIKRPRSQTDEYVAPRSTSPEVDPNQLRLNVGDS
jgi:hypothetical protein